MLHIRFIMNSPVEDILAFKTCCGLKMFDQNLEIHVRNVGDEPLRVHSRFVLEHADGVSKFDTLMPPGEQTIAPGDLVAFYCQMDEHLWRRSTQAVFFDSQGTRYPVPVSPPGKAGTE
jgi:hypothetical protein